MYFFLRSINFRKKPGNALKGFPGIPAASLMLALLFFSACNVTTHLNKSQTPLLIKNSLELKTEKPLPLDQKTPLMYELATLYRQTPNERGILALRTPARLWWYYHTEDKEHKKFARWARKKIAEPPALFQEELAIRTTNNFQNFMRQRGYFQATSSYTVKYSQRRFFFGLFNKPPKSYATASVKYSLSLGPLHHLGKVEFASQDTNILYILRQTAGRSFLKPGAPLDGRSFEAEKLRITAEMKNRGYAFFIPNFVEFNGDSTAAVTDITVEVLRQNDSSLHKTYILGNIAVFSDLVPDLSSIRNDTTIQGIYFATSGPNFEVKPGRLFDAITLRPGTQFRQSDFDETSHNLNALGIFRFVTIRPLQDSIQPEKINVTISFKLNNQLALGGGVDMNSSTNSGSTLSGRLLGVSGNLSAENRNLFRGAENVQTNLGYSLEFDLAPDRNRLIFSQEFKFSNELRFPRYFDYFGFWRSLHRLNLVSDRFYDRLRFDGQTRLTLNYNYLDLRGFYVYNLFHSAFGYDVRSSAEHQFSFDNIGIDVLRPQLQPSFQTIFGQNEFLKRSFGNQLFTGFLLRSFTYTFADKPNAFGERWFFRLNTELSGLEEYAVNRLWAIPFGKQDWKIADLEFSKYAKIDVTGTYTREFSNKMIAAIRVSAGAAASYGDTLAVPYVKQFFAGGPSSIRAWRIRELGPGGYYERDSTGEFREPAQPFYQAADFRFEFNGELRFPLFWWVKGAVFLDGGNIWTFKPDPDRPGSALGWGSYKNIALGTGFGLRFDFDYFVFRFDWGIKLRRPYTIGNEGYWVDWSGAKWQELSNFNLAVGYPF
jgi:outer membrane protein insertion porin family